MRKIENIINLLIIFCLGAFFFVLATGGGNFKIYGIRISISSFENPLKLIVILLFFKHMITEKEGLLSKFLNKYLEFIRNLFSFKKNHRGDFFEKKTFLFSSILLCVAGGIGLLIADSIKYSLGSCYKFIVHSTLPQSYYSSLFFIISSVLLYGLGGLIVGYFLQLISFSLVNSKLGPYLNKRILLLQFDIVLIALTFLIVSPFSGLELLDFYFPAYSYGKFKINNNIKELKSSDFNNVILITIDTTRADHLSMYGYSRNTTPALSMISKEGMLFTRAYSQMPTTDPSHISILTGVYPRTHGLLTNGMSISNKNIPSLPEWFRKKGYITSAITSRALLDPEEMKLKGFDYISVPNNMYESVTADITYKKAEKWIDEYGDNPFFMWVHFFDPHREYNPPSPYNSKFNDGYKGIIKEKKRPPEHKDTHFIDPKYKYTPQEIDYLTSLYDGEIAFTDEYVFKLIRYIEEKTSKNNKNPFFIITADHGEVLGEILDKVNYAFGHSQMVRHGGVHIPLILKWKGVIPKGKAIDSIVESVDFAPTIVELLDKNYEYNCDGKSFAELILNQNGNGKEAAFAQRRIFEKKNSLNFLNSPEYAVATDKWFLISNEIRGIELYDISNDTLEQRDLSKERKDVVDMLLAKLESWKKTFPSTPYKPQKMSKEKIKVLKSLGYTQ
ncbi:MAG: hypothetical protein A2W05_01955 [Candidatus Schekmanbacteria bacterium RBG_16_38_10]|uniref:Sulfatase N-terminal domain-containing protein n=1 Tax=Candidatus Schekmanbacteria bacterium RBG_16_38_10 TaxID=1817879 RepID=A0A1F7S0V6_9BACT|nr:MAG: hypothetical protein A2W05_01955 [Candidatus Schekmanbacteria bacterium RBG_16_38_10]